MWLTLCMYWSALDCGARLSSLKYIGSESKLSSSVLFEASPFLSEVCRYLKDLAEV